MTETEKRTPIINLKGENLRAFKSAVKTAYYKSMLKEGIINQIEFNKLIEIMNRLPAPAEQ